MLKFIGRRLLILIPTLILLSFLVFSIIRLIPGDPALVLLGPQGTAESLEALRDTLGLNKPIVPAYWDWIRGIFSGNWGNSLIDKKPVIDTIAERIPRTFALCMYSIIFSIILAIPLGIIAAVKNNKGADLGISVFAMLFISIPGFWLGILTLILFAVTWRILPAGGYASIATEGVREYARHMILPVITLGASLAAQTTRFLRSSMLEVMNEDYIMLARVKGCSTGRIMFVHALRNALGPIFSTISMQIAFLMGGGIVSEKVFSYPGVGLVLLEAVLERDYPLVQCGIMVFATIVMVVYLISDVLYAVIDPKIRYG